MMIFDSFGSIQQTLYRMVRYFADHQVETPRLDAELILSYVLGISRVELYTRGAEPIDSRLQEELSDLIYRRGQGEPVAYLLGQKEFFSLPLFVTSAVLIPRPETEVLVEVALKRLRDRRNHEERRGGNSLGVDVGTGSGAVAIALCKEQPNLCMVATDQSQEALQIARVNVARLGIPLQLVRANLLAGFAQAAQFDLIVSNPPYIPTADIAHLSREVRKEPHAALDGGADGLVLVRALIKEAYSRLRSMGCLTLEIGFDQAERVREEMVQRGYVDIETTFDLAHLPRIVSGKKP